MIGIALCCLRAEPPGRSLLEEEEEEEEAAVAQMGRAELERAGK